LAAVLAFPLRAADHAWVGPANGGLWHDAANWTNGKPVSGEPGGTVLYFGLAGYGISSIDDISGLIVDEIVFTRTGNVVGGGGASPGLTFSDTLTTQVSNVAGLNFFASSLPLNVKALSVNVPVGTVIIAGDVSGLSTPLSGINLSGPGTLLLAGKNALVALAPAKGVIELNSGLDGALPNPGFAFIGDGIGADGDAVVRELSANNIGDGVDINIYADGLFDLNGFSETVGGLLGPSGAVTLGGATLTLNPGTFPAVHYFSGVISGSGVVRMVGGGTQVLLGDNTYTGETDVATSGGGTLVVNGSQPASSVAVRGGALLYGGGVIGPLTVFSGGTVSPGTLATNHGGPGVLHVSGTVTLNSGATLVVDLNGTSQGTTYDWLQSDHSVFLDGANLVVETGFPPPAGTTFTVVSGASVSGTFAGIPEGGVVQSANGSTAYLVNYTPTSVVLTVCTLTVAAPPQATVTQTICQ